MNKPIFFKRNRVGRVYTGGKLFADFFGDEPVDNYFPEEWIASFVTAKNKDMLTEKDGVSIEVESGKYFDDILTENLPEMVGPSGKMRILVKVLDSAIRLPAQAHPDKEFSRKHLNSEYGKTESWYILGTRPGAKLYFGFKEGVTKADFEKAIDESENDKDAMERLMCSIEPKVGEMYLVPGKTVHAIGKGCLILEIQEPTDFIFQPEHWCGDYKLNDEQMYMGFERELAVECFEFNPSPDTKMKPTVLFEENGVKKEQIIGKKDTDCFTVNKIMLTGGKCRMNVENSYGVYIVIDGNGTIISEDYSKKIKKGDYFFLPYSAMKKYTVEGNLSMIECY